MEIFKSLVDSGILIKCFTQTIGNETKKGQNSQYDVTCIGLLKNVLSSKGLIRAVDAVYRTGHDF